MTHLRTLRAHWGILIVLVSMGAIPAGGAQRPIRFERLSLEDGLSQATVNTVFQDSRGFLWVGTEDGLNRFDGYEFIHYKNDPADLTSLPADAVWTLAEDASTDLWVATEGGGVARWDHRTDRFHRYPLPRDAELEAPRSVRTLHLDSDGRVWIGTRADGLWRLDPESGQFTGFHHDPRDPESLIHDSVFVIASAPDGTLLVGTDGGLDRLHPDRGVFTHFPHDPKDPEALADPRIRALLVDQGATVWVGTYGGGVARLRSDGTFERLRHDPKDAKSLTHDRIRALLEDQEGRIWVGTGGGLSLVDPRTLDCQNYRADPADPGSLADDDVMSIAQDRTGLLWFGTRSAGLHKWHPSSWSFGPHAPGPDGLADGTVTSFAEDRSDRLWVGTLGGGLHLMGQAPGETQYERWTVVDGVLSSFVSALEIDREDHLWVGTLDQGLYRVSPDLSELRHFSPAPDDPGGLGAEGVTSVLEDSRGTLWIGTFGAGLHRYDPSTGTFERFGEDHGLESSRVICLAEGRDGLLWAGTDAGGLSAFDRSTETFTTFRADPTDPESLPADTVFSLFADPRGTLWIGTRGNGLARLETFSLESGQASFRRFTEADGLSNDVIYGILPGARDDLWMSTNHGLSVLQPQTGRIETFHVGHGLRSEEFSFGAAFKNDAGKLFFGGVNGFNAFFPHQIQRNEQAPLVVLVGVSNLGIPMDHLKPPFALDRLELEHQDDVVTFEFAALDFVAPHRNRYVYKLEGFDEDWIDLGHHRRVTFTDLDGGSYALRVKAANGDDSWNETGLTLPIAVETPPWHTWWAYLSYLTMGGLVILGFATAQKRKLTREERYSRRLEHEVEERTEELAERNSALEQLNQELLEASLTDPLTGLRNRRFLFEHISEETTLVQRRYAELDEDIERIKVFDLVFLVVDLDHFKSINDTCGHLAGDRVLMQMRDLLSTTCRESDLLIRWGGDEFLIVGRDASPQRGEALARRIREVIGGTVFELDNGRVVRATCSIGFACFPFVRSQPNTFDWEDVLGLADAALYAAKNTSRDAWVGILSNGHQPCPDLLNRLRHEPEPLIEAGMIEIRTSIGESAKLRWS